MLNEVRLEGNVCADPEIRTMSNGNEVASFSLATTQYWKDKVSGEWKERTEFNKIVVFNEHIIRTLKEGVQKGSKVLVGGELKSRKYTDKQGAEKSVTEVVLQGFGSKLLILVSKKRVATTVKDSLAVETPKEDFDDDSIPF